MMLCSVGMAMGVLGAVMLVRRLVFRRLGYAGCHGGPRGWRGRGVGRSHWLRALFSRLDTTPGQEREIRSAIEDFQKQARDAKDDLKGARDDLARAIRGEAFDDLAAGDATNRADATAARVKDALTGALKRVHAVLDPNQRERLAELLSKGPGFRGWGGPYRA
jgi:uncharacterized membrane protein